MTATNASPLTGFKVMKPGILALIQDAGRFGCHGIGLTTGGPLDPLAFQWANRLCGNDLAATAIEISIGGLVLEASVNTRVAVTGAEMPLKINGQEQPLWQSHEVKPGDIIELGFVTKGVRAYLAVVGGFVIEPQFGSTATVVREGLGGFNGDRLQANDMLPCVEAHEGDCLRLPEEFRPEYGSEAHCRVIPGYQQKAFSRFQQRMFFSSHYLVSDRCDRMGYRLEGPNIKPSIDGILSEGICLGAIQVPADGQPIVLLNDRQTIGGYPKIGSVFSADIAKLAQLPAGALVSFEPITIDCAHNELCLLRSRFERAETAPC